MTLSESSTRHNLRGKAAILAIAVAALFTRTSRAFAAHVSGTLKGYENSAPAKAVSLHFENLVTRDSYMTLTADDGSFAAELPPGVYRLRSERGAILTGPIMVGPADATLGAVSDLAPYAPARLCGLQFLAPALLNSPAPSTANIMTLDTTAPLPPIAASGSVEPMTLPPRAASPFGVE